MSLPHEDISEDQVPSGASPPLPALLRGVGDETQEDLWERALTSAGVGTDDGSESTPVSLVERGLREAISEARRRRWEEFADDGASEPKTE